MNNAIVSFILTSLAGLSTIVGFFIIFIKFNRENVIAFSLSFAGSVMLTISLIDLIPSSISYLQKYNILFQYLIIVFFIVLGIFISGFISHRVNKQNINNLQKVGIISMIAIILHNIPEGIITFMVSDINLHLGLKLAIAIGLHNIPEGISIAIPLYYATNNKIKTFVIVLFSGLSEVLGAIICFLFLKNIINNFIIGISFSLIAGIMINISLSELLKEAFEYKEKKLIFLGLIIGCIIMIISHIL